MKLSYIGAMRLSSKSKITFDILLDIAAHTAQGRAISMPLISRRHGLSISYLEIIFSVLKAGGLIHSHRGPGGGYSLARKAQEISLYDVVCLIGDQENEREDLSTVLWANLATFMTHQMQQVNLDQVLNRSSIVIEESTKGFSFARTSGDTKTVNPTMQKVGKQLTKQAKPRLGPNSVFAFGKYLKSV